MKCIIAGSRGITSYDTLQAALAACPFTDNIKEVVSGGARGADHLGEMWATHSGLELTCMPAKWAMHGRAAGPVRNREMAKYAATCKDGGALIALWDGSSRGTRNMIDEAKLHGLRVFVWDVVNDREMTEQ
jgi:hypothetical protein